MKSIQARLIILVSIGIFVLMTGVELVTVNLVKNDIIETTYEQLLEVAEERALYVESRVSGELAFIKTLAGHPILIDKEATFEEKLAFFKNQAIRSGYSNFAMVDREGNATVFNDRNEKLSVAGRDYFKSALGGKPTCSDVILMDTGALEIILAAPVYDGEVLAGVFYGRIDAKILSDIVSSSQFRDTGFSYMINTEGVRVADQEIANVKNRMNDITRANSDPAVAEVGVLTTEMLGRVAGTGSYEENGVEKMLGYAPVKSAPWVVTVGVETEEILLDLEAIEKLLITVTVCGIGLAAVYIFFVSGSITKGIKQATKAATLIAEGNFDVELNVKSKDEVGQLAQAFSLTIDQLKNYRAYIDEISNALYSLSQGDLTVKSKLEYTGEFARLKDNMDQLVKQLNETMLGISEAASQVDSGADQVANGAQALSQGATEQASSIEELSAAIAETTAQIRQSATDAKAAHDTAQETGKVLQVSTAQMQEMLDAMNLITQKSTEIGKIVKIIDDIAFQTNILSLNAAVEAARAGEAGKGFAVVADEVRNLASKSAEAAKSTTDLIEHSLQAVNNGSLIAQKTSDALSNVARETAATVQLIDRIAEASQLQATSIVQISQGIEQVSAVVQTNAATAEESAAASEELTGQSHLLRQLISVFKLKGQEQSLYYTPETDAQTQNYAEFSDFEEVSSKY